MSSRRHTQGSLDGRATAFAVLLAGVAAMALASAPAQAAPSGVNPMGLLPAPGEEGVLIRGDEGPLQWQGAAIPADARIDGISDQNLPYWNGRFATSPFVAFLRGTWIGEPPARIAYARYVVQWNVMAGRAVEPDRRYYEAFSAWYGQVRALGLIPVLALRTYTGPPPRSVGAYGAALAQLLSAFPVPYVEAWNEPNLTGGLSVAGAAHLMDEAYEYCRGHRCVAIAGDFADTPGSAAYAAQYKRDLSPTEYPQAGDPPEWAVHPYEAVNDGGTEAEAIKAELAADDQLWVTEVGAYYCRSPDRQYGEGAQAASALRLLDNVIPALNPVHVFYYEFMYKDSEETPCASESDTALYVGASDRARAAASVIFGG